jgi:hypothetical protein
MKNNDRGAYINGVPTYAHYFSLFSLVFILFSLFVRLFSLAFLYSLFLKRVLQKQDITQEYKKYSRLSVIYFML